jgi:hypothetical protein
MDEADQPIAHILVAVAGAGELGCDVVVFDDWPGQQLGKKQHVVAVVEQACGGHRDAAVEIDHIGNLLENDEGYAQRQRHDGHGQRVNAPGKSRQQNIEVSDRESGVLGIDQQSQIARHAGGHEQFAPAWTRRRRRQIAPEKPVEQRRGEHYEDKDRLAPGVKDDAAQQEQRTPGWHKPVKRKERGQEDEQEKWSRK